MIRLAWRQMRITGIATVVLLAALVVTLVLTNRSMTAFMHNSGLSSCLASNGDCNDLIDSFTSKYDVTTSLVSVLSFVPALVGLFWGAPLIAREVEQATHRLVWTQSISRRRWLTIRIGLFLVAAAALGAVLTWLLTWWYGPLIQAQPDGYDSIQPSVFELRGIVLVATMLFAFALGTAAGAVIRRTVPAMGVTLAGYVGERLFFLFERGHLIPPKSVTMPFGQVDAVPQSAWVLNQSIIDGTGHTVGLRAVAEACGSVTVTLGKGPGTLAPCAAAQGFRSVVTYQPLSRFWPLQGIESGILVAAAVLLLGAAAWWTLRRIS
jgi:hypothetical protein